MKSDSILKQLIRFGLVGCLATSCAFLLLYIQINWLQLSPIVANFLALAPASIVSFVGHKTWTFQAKKNTKQHLLRFYILIVSTYIFNQILFACSLKLIVFETLRNRLRLVNFYLTCLNTQNLLSKKL